MRMMMMVKMMIMMIYIYTKNKELFEDCNLAVTDALIMTTQGLTAPF